MSLDPANTADLIQQVKRVFLEKIPFNKLIGLQATSLDLDSGSLRIEMREELVGNFIQGTLHGGVISATLDVMGGLTAFLDLLKRMDDRPAQEMLARLAKFGTIDLRIDYLRPGRGRHFDATGSVLRTGNKVSVTRMELHNDEGVLIAVGTGTYLVA